MKRAPVRLETSLSVKSSVVTKEEVTVARGGKVVDERSRETKENNYYASSTSEIWEPVGIVHRPRNIKPFDSSDDSRPNSNASSDQGYTTNASSNQVLRERGGAAIIAGCPICEDNDPDCARRCLAGLDGLGDGIHNCYVGINGAGESVKVPGVQTTTSAVSIHISILFFHRLPTGFSYLSSMTKLTNCFTDHVEPVFYLVRIEIVPSLVRNQEGILNSQPQQDKNGVIPFDD